MYFSIPAGHPAWRHETIQHTLTESFSSACSFNSDPFLKFTDCFLIKDTFWKRIHLLQGSWCQYCSLLPSVHRDGKPLSSTKMTPSSKHDAGRISKSLSSFMGKMLLLCILSANPACLPSVPVLQILVVKQSNSTCCLKRTGGLITLDLSI